MVGVDQPKERGMKRLRTWRAGTLVGLALMLVACVVQPAASLVAQQPARSSVAMVQCPAMTLCLGIGVNGPNLVTSRAPRSGASAWVAQSIDGGRPLKLLSCASVRFCLAVDHENRVLVSTDPARGA